MRIIVTAGAAHPDLRPFDAAERKGIGHPDSLADLVADSFSRRYASECLAQHGVVPNHWVDKVTLVGAGSTVRFGGYDIDKPVDCYLFGKITEQVGGQRIDIRQMFADTVHCVLPEALADTDIGRHLRLQVNNSAGVAVDHDAQFYHPYTASELGRVLRQESVANDTVLCAGAAIRGAAAELAIWLERLLVELPHPALGTDVKVMVVRAEREFDITACVPVRPEQVASWQEYRALLADVEARAVDEIKLRLDGQASGFSLRLNTKDIPGRGYLAPFGTSLGKGDCGAVGRGNRFNGAIEPLRPAGGEAPAGKNPVHHVGKIYSAVADEAARRIMAETGAYAEVLIAARNGDTLSDPAYVLVSISDERAAVQAAAEAIIGEVVGAAAEYCDSFLDEDPIARFRTGAAS